MGKLRGSAIAAVMALGLGAWSGAAFAAVHSIDTGKVQALAAQIEAALAAAGPDATAQDDVATIQSVIAQSGADPFLARAALHLVDKWSSLTTADSAAVATVDQTIDEALEGSRIPHSGGPGGGTPIGVPFSYVTGGGSDYTPK
jgi:hypothetical protein